MTTLGLLPTRAAIAMLAGLALLGSSAANAQSAGAAQDPGASTTSASAASSSVAPAPGAALPAEWARHNLLVQFRKLPKRYTCDELWYKFRDVLLRLGAAPNMDILPDRCHPSVGAAAYSPRVRIEFFTPRRLEGTTASAASLNVDSREVRIAPGEPESIKADDCALLRQMKSALPGKVVRFHLACRAPAKGDPAFDVVVRTLIPTDGAALHASATSKN